MFLSRSQPPGGEGAWRFAVYPLLQKERVEGFLCMENARRHADDAALVNALLPLLQREPERFSRSGGMAGDVGRLMGMPDLRAYLATVAGLDAARYTSLGAVCLDIPGIAAINGSHGFAYGSQLLWYACQAMASGVIPQIMAVFGICGGGMAVSAAMADFTFMEEKSVTGEAVIEEIRNPLLLK